MDASPQGVETQEQWLFQLHPVSSFGGPRDGSTSAARVQDMPAEMVLAVRIACNFLITQHSKNRVSNQTCQLDLLDVVVYDEFYWLLLGASCTPFHLVDNFPRTPEDFEQNPTWKNVADLPGFPNTRIWKNRPKARKLKSAHYLGFDFGNNQQFIDAQTFIVEREREHQRMLEELQKEIERRAQEEAEE